MTDLALTIVLLTGALAGAAWSGLLALAEESPQVASALGHPPAGAEDPIPLHRALYLSRMVLLFVTGVLVASAVVWWRRPWLEGLVVALVATAFLFIVSDALPRAAGVLAPDLSSSAAALAKRSLVPFRPLLGLVGALERRINGLIPARPGGRALAPTQRDILLGIFSLGDTTVAEIMTPRLDLAAVEARATWEEVVGLLRQSQHARIPVYTDTPDNIAGVLHAKDLVPAISGIRPVPDRWQNLIRPVQFVPESKSIAAQLRDFQRGPGHLAIVVDEFGGTSGLITLEDILEEIVGEIHDEYDIDEEPAIEREGDDRFWVDGRVNIDTLSTLLGTPIEREGVSTIGGLIYAELGRVPRQGEELRLGEFRVVLEDVARRRVRRVYIERMGAASPVSGAGAEQG